jgi:hypothetical protein
MHSVSGLQKETQLAEVAVTVIYMTEVERDITNRRCNFQTELCKDCIVAGTYADDTGNGELIGSTSCGAHGCNRFDPSRTRNLEAVRSKCTVTLALETILV